MIHEERAMPDILDHRRRWTSAGLSDILYRRRKWARSRRRYRG